MSVESRESIDWNKLGYTKVRVLRGLASGRSEREIAEESGVEYTTVRGHVAEIKDLTGRHDVRELGRWWRRVAPDWHRWCAQQAGLDDGETGRTVG